MAHDKNLPWYAGPYGVTNVTRQEAQSFCRKLVQSSEYRQKLEARLLRGDLPPALEAMIWHYAFGKPAETINLNVQEGQEDLSGLSTEELLERSKKLQEALEEATAVENAINVTPVTH
jgi:hypothetical protein